MYACMCVEISSLTPRRLCNMEIKLCVCWYVCFSRHVCYIVCVCVCVCVCGMQTDRPQTALRSVTRRACCQDSHAGYHDSVVADDPRDRKSRHTSAPRSTVFLALVSSHGFLLLLLLFSSTSSSSSTASSSPSFPPFSSSYSPSSLLVSLSTASSTPSFPLSSSSPPSSSSVFLCFSRRQVRCSCLVSPVIFPGASLKIFSADGNKRSFGFYSVDLVDTFGWKCL